MRLFQLSIVLSALALFHVVKPDDLARNVIEKDPSVSEVAQSLVEVLGVKLENATDKRFQELKEKLDQISTYVIDKDFYAELLHNETIDTNLTQISFYKALNESSRFQYLFEKDPKSVYLKLKEKMNRDDILKLLSEKTGSALGQSARRMMDEDGRAAVDGDGGAVDREVDQYIAAKARDGHSFDQKDIEQMYWDPQAELEDRQAPTRRIYMGERTTVRDYPFMVSLHVMKRFWCGGVLYWQDLVITSASCLQLMHNNRFYRENPRVLQIRVGSNHSRVGGEMVDAMEVYFHPGYGPRTLASNVAVVRLRHRLVFSYHRVPKALRLSHESHLVPYTSSVLLLGWGVIRTTNKMRFEPIFMQRKLLPVYPNKFCKEVYGDKFITEQMFCAGTMSTGEGACDHDAGGPAILNGRLVGVISFGPTVCGFPNAPTVFTLVGAFADWIETVNESMPSYYRNYERSTFPTPSTFDFSSLKAMFETSTAPAQIGLISSATTAASHIATPTGGREGSKVKFSEEKLALEALEADEFPDTRTNMPLKYLKPVVAVTTLRSHKGHHHDKQREAKKDKDLKLAAELVQKLQDQARKSKKTKSSAESATKTSKTHRHHHKNKA